MRLRLVVGAPCCWQYYPGCGPTKAAVTRNPDLLDVRGRLNLRKSKTVLRQQLGTSHFSTTPPCSPAERVRPAGSVCRTRLFEPHSAGAVQRTRGKRLGLPGPL